MHGLGLFVVHTLCIFPFLSRPISRKCQWIVRILFCTWAAGTLPNFPHACMLALHAWNSKYWAWIFLLVLLQIPTMLLSVVFVLFSLSSAFCGVITSIQLAEFLSSQRVNSSSSFLGIFFLSGGCSNPFFLPVLWDLLLLAIFVLQHSGMVSSFWKDTLSNWGLQPIQRSLYVFATAMSLQWIMSRFESLPGPSVWFIDTAERPLLWFFFLAVHVLCWLTIYGSALTMDFGELIGFKQVLYYISGNEQPLAMKSQQVQRLYRHLRHPGVLPMMVILWLHPIMSVSRLLVALTWSLYLIFGHSVTHEDYDYVTCQMKKKAHSLRDQFGLFHWHHKCLTTVYLQCHMLDAVTSLCLANCRV